MPERGEARACGFEWARKKEERKKGKKMMTEPKEGVMRWIFSDRLIRKFTAGLMDLQEC